MMGVVGVRWTGVFAGLCLLVDLAGAQITRPAPLVKPWEKDGAAGAVAAETAGVAGEFPEKKWFQNGSGFSEAREIQKTTGADIIVYFARYFPADEKGLCNWFEQRGLGNPEVEKYLRGYIKVKFLYPLGKADEEAAANFRVGKCPAVYIVQPTGHPNRAPVIEWPAGKPEMIKPDVLIENFRSRSSPRYQGAAHLRLRRANPERKRRYLGWYFMRRGTTCLVTPWRMAWSVGVIHLWMSLACPTVGSHALDWPAAYHFPELGWREPVIMTQSGWRVDRLLETKPVNSYNCHYYTKSHIEQRDLDTVPFRAAVPSGIENISPLYLQGWGYYELDRDTAQPGDIIIAEKPAQEGGGRRHFTHSAVVACVDDEGHITRIRQKFDPRHPVVEMSLTDFITVYVGGPPRSYAVWRKVSPVQLADAGQN